tara:strand:- start:347 stop:889 length:543 start_codon:yes stop_codon:yes gene_type:complete
MLNIIKLLSIFLLINFNLYANSIGEVTGYKIPRFVSLKSDDVNLRIGSSTNYPITLKYIIKNMPIEITEEYEMWRKVRDIEGNEGWIHKNLLKGDRYAIVYNANESFSRIYFKPNGDFIGEIGKLNIVKINTCLIDWCKISFNNISGWIKKDNLWGCYKDEKFNIPFYQPLINLVWKINF